MRNTHKISKFNKQARILFAGFAGVFSTSINKILLDAQISECNKKLSTTSNAYGTSQDNRITTPTAPQLHNLHNNHPLSLVPRNYRNLLVIEHISTSHSYPKSPVTHVVAHQPNIEDKYEQIIEQPHTNNFRSQNNHLFSPR